MADDLEQVDWQNLSTEEKNKQLFLKQNKQEMNGLKLYHLNNNIV